MLWRPCCRFLAYAIVEGVAENVEQWTVSPNSPLLLSYGCLPMVALCYLCLPSVALFYLLLHIGKDHTLYIYHDLVSLAGQIIHPSIHSFIL
jgi:hypothetical protein